MTNAGWREIGNSRIYFRSMWEANYARYLEWLREQHQIAGWWYEPETFWFEKIRRGVRSYKPDFLVCDLNGNKTYYEIKGYMDARSKTKIKRMALYYPDVKLIVIGQSNYALIARMVGKLIPGWESQPKQRGISWSSPKAWQSKATARFRSGGGRSRKF